MNTNLLLALFTIAWLSGLAGCSTPAHVKLPSKQVLKERHEAALTLADLAPAKVTILAGDTLHIMRDAQEPTEQGEMALFLVRPDGYIAVPGISSIKVAGLTPEQVSEEITEHYSKIYREPKVTVNIAKAPNNRIFVGGAVPNPAFFDLSSAATLEQAILASGGVLPSANSKHIALLRTNEEGRYDLYFLDLANLLSDTNRKRIVLQRSDLIYVPQSRIGATVEAVDMYFTRLFPVNKGIGVGFNYDLNNKGIKDSGNTYYINQTP